MLSGGLKAKGLKVETVATGAAALDRIDEAASTSSYLDVLAREHERDQTVPLIVVTSRTDPLDRERAMALGVAAYLTKPCKWEHLWEAIDRCLG